MALADLKTRSWYPVVYMFVVTAFFSAILIGFARLTRERVEANQKLAVERAVLLALPIAIPPAASNAQVHELYLKAIQAPPAGPPEQPYRLERDRRVEAYAVPFEGRGFWDVIKGVIGIAADRRTLTGIAFYQQRETPGLGAEITKPRFRDQFSTGKKRMAETGPPLTFVPEGENTGPSEINAITGATQTSVRLQRTLNEQLTKWRKSEAAAEPGAAATDHEGDP